MNAAPTQPMQAITHDELRELLAAHRGATFVGFTALTQPDQRVSPWGTIYKLSKVSTVTGAHYSHALAKVAPQFAVTGAQERVWGERAASCLVEKIHPATGAKSYYLPAQNPRTSRPLYLVRNRETGRLQAIAEAQVQPYLRLRAERPSVEYRDYRLDHIVSLAWHGQRYRVRQTQ